MPWSSFFHGEHESYRMLINQHSFLFNNDRHCMLHSWVVQDHTYPAVALTAVKAKYYVPPKQLLPYLVGTY